VGKYIAYSAYKDSGSESIGNIPEHWEVMKLKFLGEALIGITYSPSEVVNENNGILVFRSSNVQSGKIDYEDCVYVDKEIQEKQLTQAGDILICSRNGSINLIGKNALIDKSSAGVTFGAFMTIFRSQNYSFLRYFFNSQNFKNQSGLFSTSTINQLTTGVLNNIFTPIPKSITEQQQIADFLDDKTIHLDKLIGQKQQMIGLLNEKRMALITQAVTKGLDLSVPMKDSGVEWLGDVPGHWEIRKLKFSVDLISNKCEAKGSELQFIGLENIESYTGKMITVNSELESEGIALSYQANDVLFCKLRPYLAKVYLAGNSGLCTSELLVLRGTEAIPNFLKYFLLSKEFINIVDSSTYGTKMPRANWEFIGNLACLIPSEGEQQQITNYLDTETKKIDEMITTVKQAVATLQEYRTALITAAVTGKIDVRGFKLPKQTTLDDLAGCTRYHGAAKTLEDMDATIEQGIIAKWGRHDSNL